MNRIAIGIIFGIIAGKIDVIPMVLQKLHGMQIYQLFPCGLLQVF